MDEHFYNWMKEQGFYLVHEYWMYKNRLVSEETLESKLKEFKQINTSK